MSDNIGKLAEGKIKQWLDRPDLGQSFDRIPDQMTGFYGSQNICDFILYKHPNMMYIESKSTWNDRFDFSMITDHQFNSLLHKSRIEGCYGLIIILFATHKKAFILNIETINSLISSGKKSINVTKLDKWNFKYAEIETVPSNKKLLDYSGDISDYLSVIT